MAQRAHSTPAPQTRDELLTSAKEKPTSVQAKLNSLRQAIAKENLVAVAKRLPTSRLIQKQERQHNLYSHILLIGALGGNALWVAFFKDPKKGPVQFITGDEADDLASYNPKDPTATLDEAILLQPFKESWRCMKLERGEAQEQPERYKNKIKNMFKGLAYRYILNRAAQDGTATVELPPCTSEIVIEVLKNIGEGERLVDPSMEGYGYSKSPDGKRKSLGG